jgi:type I restriction enzyme S subunit
MMLPEGWRLKRIEEVGKVVTGNTPSTANQDFYGGEVPFVTPGDLGKQRDIATAERTLSASGAACARTVPAGATLVTCIGSTIGKVGFSATELATNQQINSVIPSSEHDPAFIYYQIQALTDTFKSLAGTQAVPLLNKSTFSAIRVHVPPTKAEEEAVAAILSTWDQAIATTERLLANSQRKVDALLQKLLINPAARGEWLTAPISEISERVQRRANEGAKLPVLMISSGSGFVRQDEKYSRFMAGKSVENYVALNRGEFAYNKGNSRQYEFGCVFPLRSHERGLVPHVYVCFKLSAGQHADFYEHLFRADYLHDQLGALVNTGVRNNGLLNIRPGDFLTCEVPVPPLEEQQRIAEVLSTATTWVEQQAHDLDLLKQEKAALMSQLLTGKCRVELPEAETEAQA